MIALLGMNAVSAQGNESRFVNSELLEIVVVTSTPRWLRLPPSIATGEEFSILVGVEAGIADEGATTMLGIDIGTHAFVEAYALRSSKINK